MPTRRTEPEAPPSLAMLWADAAITVPMRLWLGWFWPPRSAAAPPAPPETAPDKTDEPDYDDIA